jgi:hypothetical protein
MGTQSGKPLDLSGTQIGRALSAQMPQGGPMGSKGTGAMPPPPGAQNMVRPQYRERERANPGQAHRQDDFRSRQSGVMGIADIMRTLNNWGG